MKKILYISMSLEGANYGGSIVSRVNLNAIKNQGDVKVTEVALVRKFTGVYDYELQSDSSKIKIAANNLRGFAGRLNCRVMSKIKAIIKEDNPDILYLDSSLLGSIARWCKLNFKHITVITFFHNIEADFELQRLKTGAIFFLPSLFSSVNAERKAVKYSDTLITLHQIDANRLLRLYGRKSDFNIPVCIEDELADEIACCIESDHPKKDEIFFVGFIGTAFYANTKAAEFISHKIAAAFSDKPDIKFIIAGNGFDKYASTLERSNLKVYGYIDSLEQFYSNIDVIISPIFYGAGMKVKIAEALKYNKKILASSFSLIGYEELSSSEEVMTCNTSDEFIASIEKMKNTRDKCSNSREYFLKNYSCNACIEYFKKIL
ncbi:glycosyltransferase [Citrobacter amalonaticus]|uniref:WffD n=1 Tax=Citrobacter amalonaticus TaxID=35703 RepID=A0AAW9MCZ5_CITAM|nr:MULTISPECIES: glycosyltransferase [Citrobacter]ELR9585020.1 glycosyltransferase [Citrobacter amalonaticus]MDM3520746.1 glycosyltransferase [Citrobacter sp. Ca225]MDV2140621.1 glycosyltransferase [Citrobacter amalonaticus]MEB0588127.1 glycosyltransferase [Citrobacter amalonaticus]QIO40436.1 glycosyltransferase family 4 protein [Citrobacter sp. Y3]